eukprot:CAMPEP_0172457810 /NCGR_PEP_ID=MMETSP1065-20121228/24330_1 /TAXON_ID=265537 /ORGANISM="Amphiprora paludosa, Strain CCMP125" /LENGTH=166 /DNA_ID=CAMNT_0013211751 /DNA_START=58 /DNA_END=555 /DNA_ORIENTATION=-
MARIIGSIICTAQNQVRLAKEDRRREEFHFRLSSSSDTSIKSERTKAQSSSASTSDDEYLSSSISVFSETESFSNEFHEEYLSRKTNTTAEHQDPTIEEFILKTKHKSVKTLGGMHWQEDPTGRSWLHHGWNWPRDYASIRGQLVVHKGKKWLLAEQVRQVGETEW